MTQRADEADGLPLPQRYGAILAIALGITMAVLDGAIANVALPTIARDMQASPASSIWVVNAYQLAITILMLPLASLGDIVGYRRVYGAGLVVFTLASLACALAASLPALTAARVLQGIGAAGILSVNGALVRFIYPRDMLGRGIGVNTIVVAVSAALGPTVAAAILAVASWPWLFAINVPIVGVALEAAAALLAGVALVLRQLPQTSPLLPVDLLRIPIFALSIATSVCSFMAQMLAYVALPFYLQDALGRSQVATGLRMTPWPLATAVAAPLAGRLADRYPAGALGGIGLAAFAAGLLLLALLPAHPGNTDIAWRMAICGFGFGLFQAPNNRAILSAAPRERSGGASGMLGTARLLGQTTGAALMALMFTAFGDRATSAALLASAGIALVAAGVSCARLMERNRAR